MPSKKRAGNKKKGSQSNFAKLSIFQPNKYKFKKSCPLSVKGAPEVDYKNIRLLKKYMSENGKILPSRITNVSQKKQRELSLSIKRARNLAYAIKKNKKGIYMHFKIKGSGKIIEELEKNEIIDKNLLRYMTVRVKKFNLEAKYFSKKDEYEKKDYKKDYNRD